MENEQESSPAITPAHQSTERFQEIAANFSRTLQAVQRNSVARVNEAYNTYVATLAGTQRESQKQAADVLRTYSAAAQDAACQPDAPKQHEQAYRNYIEMLGKAHEEVQKRHQEAVWMCAASLQQARDATRSHSIEAYRTYVQSLKETWADVDVDAIVTTAAANIQAY
jgi:hypothetical protein